MLANAGRIVALFALLIPFGASAAEFRDSIYVGAMASIVDDDETRDIDVEDEFNTYHALVGTGFIDKRAFELSATRTRFHRDGPDPDVKQRGLDLSYLRRFGTSQEFIPYAIAGVGYLETKDTINDIDTSGPSFSIGLGVLSPTPVFGLSFRAELRLRNDMTPAKSDFQEVFLSFGLQRHVWRHRVSVADLDADGVPDALDRCGDTRTGADVDEFGCARDADADQDGVPDFQDMCGGSPSGSKVDQFGCVIAPTAPADPRNPV